MGFEDQLQAILIAEVMGREQEWWIPELYRFVGRAVDFPDQHAHGGGIIPR